MSSSNQKKLAIFGGQKIVPDKLVKPWPVIGEAEKQAVLSVLERGVLWLPYAPEVVALQNEWAEYIGVKYCLAANSGTAALHMCVAALGIGPGDEVITTPFSWTSTATCILHHNAIPVFADIEPDTYVIDAKTIERKITEHTKAILIVHMFGLPADMEEIAKIARKHNIPIIEDACQAHGAQYKGRMVGTIGDVAAFSLNGSKTLGCGEGGLFVTDEENLWQEAARVQQFGEARRRDGKREYNAYGMGWMYRITELQAAFARCQLKRLDEYVDSIRENCDYLRSLISGLDGFNSPIEPMDRKHAYWRYIIRVTPEELGINTPVEDFTRRVRAALIAEGVKCARLEFVIPEMTLFQEKRGYGKGCPWTCNHYRGDVDYKAENYPVAMDTTSRLISLEGIKPPNGKPLMDKYAEAIHKVYENLEQLLDSDVEIEADNVNDLNVY